MENKIKYRAKQIPPEYQESPLSYDIRAGMKAEDLGAAYYIDGGRHFYGLTGEHLETVKRNALQAYYDMSDGAGVKEALSDNMISRTNGKNWTPRQLGQWKDLLTDCAHGGRGYDPTDPDHVTWALELITGAKWDWKYLRGCSQGDVVTLYYQPDKLSEDGKERIEREYWNLGSEYDVSPTDDPDDRCSYYVTAWDEDEQRAELAEALGCKPEEIELLIFDGWTRTPKYKTA